MSEKIGKDNKILTYKSQRLPLDRVTGGVGITDTNHSQVHAGNAYHHSQAISLGNGGVSVHTLDIPAGVYVHFQNFDMQFSQPFTLEIIEGDTPATGTEDTPVNRNRVSTETSAVTIHDTAVTVNTTLLSIKSVDAAARTSLGVQDNGIEWVFLPGKSYTMRITNDNTITGNGYISLDWYEEGDGIGAP